MAWRTVCAAWTRWVHTVGLNTRGMCASVLQNPAPRRWRLGGVGPGQGPLEPQAGYTDHGTEGPAGADGGVY